MSHSVATVSTTRPKRLQYAVSKYRKMNVLLIVADSLRARNLGHYGYSANTSPFLDDWAQSATVFEQVKAPGSDSITSHASMWTGYDVLEHSMVIAGQEKLAPGHSV